MDVSKEQKAIKVFAIISLIFGIISLVFGVMMIVGGGVAAGNVNEIVTDTGVTADEVGEFSALFIITGLFAIFSAITDIIDWFLLKRVANDATKYKPAWIVTLVSAILSCLSLVMALFNGNYTTQEIVNYVFALALDCVILYLINKVKKSVTAA